MATCDRASLLLASLLAGCAATGATPRDGGMPMDDGSISPTLDGGPRAECSDMSACPHGFVCAAVAGVPRCVPDPNPPPPGDGTDCSPCPAPGECRMSVCVQPSPTGGVCEFDSVCDPGQLCIAGRCSPDPRTPIPCTSDTMCPTGLYCAPGGTCGCHFTTDCAGGLACVAGTCDNPMCVADMDCPAMGVCEAGNCRDRSLCDIVNPDFRGDWTMHSRLNVRAALPDWLASLLDTLEGPFRFLAGDAACFDFGLPSAIETEVCDLVRPFLDMYLPPWSAPVFRAIADMNEVLSTWDIDEHMHLDAGSATDSYRGTHTWDRITFYYRAMALSGTPATIADWRFSPSPFNASAVCGTFYIDRHDVNVSIGGLIAWIADTLVYELSDHMYSSVSDALATAAAGLCEAFGTAADGAVDYPGVGDTVRSVCTSELHTLIDEAIHMLIDARVGASPITLRGEAAIEGPGVLNGDWYGTLLGGDFPGIFCARASGDCSLPPP